jgi:hypothetical protein
MKLKHLSSWSFSLLLGVVLALSVGCDKGGGGGSVNAGEVAALEAKVAQGDGDAAMKLGEMFAGQSGKDNQIEAAKWFHVAGRLGNATAKMGLEAVTTGMPLEDQSEAELRAEKVNYPRK